MKVTTIFTYKKDEIMVLKV